MVQNSYQWLLRDLERVLLNHVFLLVHFRGHHRRWDFRFDLWRSFGPIGRQSGDCIWHGRSRPRWKVFLPRLADRRQTSRFRSRSPVFYRRRSQIRQRCILVTQSERAFVFFFMCCLIFVMQLHLTHVPLLYNKNINWGDDWPCYSNGCQVIVSILLIIELSFLPIVINPLPIVINPFPIVIKPIVINPSVTYPNWSRYITVKTLKLCITNAFLRQLRHLDKRHFLWCALL